MPKVKTNLTDAELALLGLLMENPMHGYQMEQLIEERGMREWTPIGFSSIYYLLEKMKEKGWLISSLSSAAGKGPARQVYQITSEGRKIWKEAVLSALEHPHQPYGNFIIGLANIPFLERDEILNAVKHYRAHLKERLSHVQAKQASYGNSLPWEVAQLFEYSSRNHRRTRLARKIHSTVK
jgi:DNA-binding PadR family transcriptional regulator